MDRHHKPIVLRLDVELNFIDDEIERLDFNQCDFTVLNQSMQQIDWNRLMTVGSVDAAIDIFYSELFRVFRTNIPLKRTKRKLHTNMPWWNANIRNLRNRLRKARKRYFKHRGESLKTEMREIEAQYNSLNARCFRDYIHRIENDVKADPKSFWKYINNRKSTKGIPQNTRYQGVSAFTPRRIERPWTRSIATIRCQKLCKRSSLACKYTLQPFFE